MRKNGQRRFLHSCVSGCTITLVHQLWTSKREGSQSRAWENMGKACPCGKSSFPGCHSEFCLLNKQLPRQPSQVTPLAHGCITLTVTWTERLKSRKSDPTGCNCPVADLLTCIKPETVHAPTMYDERIPCSLAQTWICEAMAPTHQQRRLPTI